MISKTQTREQLHTDSGLRSVTSQMTTVCLCWRRGGGRQGGGRRFDPGSQDPTKRPGWEKGSCGAWAEDLMECLGPFYRGWWLLWPQALLEAQWQTFTSTGGGGGDNGEFFLLNV